MFTLYGTKENEVSTSDIFGIKRLQEKVVSSLFKRKKWKLTIFFNQFHQTINKYITVIYKSKHMLL